MMKAIIKPAAVLVVICLIVTAAVAGVNQLTYSTIEKNEAAAAQESMESLIPDTEFEPLDLKSLKSTAAYKAEDKGYVFTSSAVGYGGDVSVMTAVDADGKIIGVIILSCDDETPGLGQNCKKKEFTDQFKGKSGEVELDKNGGEIKAITSATYTSVAVRNSVNIALSDYKILREGGK